MQINNTNFPLLNIINRLPVHIYWKDINGVLLGCNQKTLESFGCLSDEDYIGKTDYDLFPKEQANELMRIDREVMRAGNTVIVEEISNVASGEAALFLSVKIPLKNEKEEVCGIVGISVDTTAIRKISLNELHVLNSIIALIPGHVYWKDNRGNYLGCNNGQAFALGLKSRDEIKNKTPYSDLPQAEAEKLLENDKMVLEQEQTITMEEVGVRENGEQGIFITKKTPLYDSDKKVTGLLGVSIDITDRKKAEAELAIANERIESMRLVSASIAHELRTPLHSIRLFASGLESFLPDLIQAYELARTANLDIPPIDNESLEMIKNGIDGVYRQVDHASLVIDMLLTNLSFNKVDKQQFAVHSMADCVEEALAIYPFSAREKELIHFSRDADFQFLGSRVLIIRVILNILKNAVYSIAAAHRGEIKLWIEGNTLYIEDTARGISAEALPHIFNQFFTKDTAHGTGIGLAFCKMCIEEHGGEIACESEQGVYARFIISFPPVD